MKVHEVRFELRGINFTYDTGEGFAVADVNLTLQPGQIAAVLGPNGSGKTTMLKLANGRLKPEAGEIRYEGRPLQSYSRREIGQRLGFVPQQEKISFDYTVQEYVSMGRTPWLNPLDVPAKEDLEITAEAVHEVGMDRYLNQKVTKLSGGQLQLVLLARALAQQTGVLLLDEASSQLDLGNKRRFLDILHRLAEQGKSILLTSHEPDFAIAAATKVILMKKGKVLVAGPMDKVLTKDNLETIYETPIELMEIGGRKVVLWT